MTRQFPQAMPDTRLIALYTAGAENLPIAVVDATGRLIGCIEPSIIFRKVAAEIDTIVDRLHRFSSDVKSVGFEAGASRSI